MSDDFTIEFRGDYLHIRHAPGHEIDREAMIELWEAVNEASRIHKCRLIFSEGEIAVRKPKILPAFEAAKMISTTQHGFRIACYFKGHEQSEVTDFFKTAAANRGMQIEYFSDREAAFRWLGVKENKVGVNSC